MHLKKRVFKNGHCSYQVCNSSLMKQVHIREESAAHAHAPYTCTGHPPDWFNCRFTSHVSDVTFVSALLDILENETTDHLTDHFPIYSPLQKLENKFPCLSTYCKIELKSTNKVISTLMFTAAAAVIEDIELYIAICMAYLDIYRFSTGKCYIQISVGNFSHRVTG